MTSTTTHRTSKQRRFSFIPMLVTSTLLMVATLMGCLNLSTVHVQARARAIPLMDGKVDIYSTITQTNTRFTLTNKSGEPITSLTLYEFYNRPTGFCRVQAILLVLLRCCFSLLLYRLKMLLILVHGLPVTT